jgi:hypothetical protein
MDFILKRLICSHLLLASAIILFSSGPEGIVLIPILFFWCLCELFLIVGLIKQFFIKENNRGYISLWGAFTVTSFVLFYLFSN